MELNKLIEQIFGAAIEVHKAIGPGLSKSAYEECLSHEMRLRSLRFDRQMPLPVTYKGINLNCGYRLDFLVEKLVVLELKAVDIIAPIHEAQVLTNLKLGGRALGLLINFKVQFLKNGIKGVVLNYEDVSASFAPLQ